jgi:hypothetical protein
MLIQGDFSIMKKYEIVKILFELYLSNWQTYGSSLWDSIILNLGNFCNIKIYTMHKKLNLFDKKIFKMGLKFL